MESRKTIKSLEVSDFRGLQGSRILDFEGADIVLLLGLNGFGKTSVFDSIEWCLTGKIGRYEQYTEVGRKQDFGKEKEVLRNKYATDPNTFVKVNLENGVSFGRRILSDNNGSDYNMGSIIDGCQYGLGSIVNDAVKPELVNSYFSATHILSQETINHFVTSKKPEERYQALSVNFGTAIFTPFEKNIQALLGKIAESEKDLKQFLKSRYEIISTLKTQIGMKKEDISNKLKEANDLIQDINNLSDDVFCKPLKLKSNIISFRPDFEEYVSNAKSHTNLDHLALKERIVEVRFLKDNVDAWKEGNKELSVIEKSISKDKNTIAELDAIHKIINDIKRESSRFQKTLSNVGAQGSNIESAIESLPHYVEVSKKISEIEKAIQNRNEEISDAKKKSPGLEMAMENKKQEKTLLEIKINELKSVLSNINNNQEFYISYQSEHGSTIQNINKANGIVEALKVKSDKYRAALLVLDTSKKLSSIKTIIDNKDYADIIQAELVKKLTVLLNDVDNIDKEIEKNNKEEDRLAQDETKIRNRFSETRKLLSSALSQIDKKQENSFCPVCDTSHRTQSLVRHIEDKLGVEESGALNDVYEKLLEVRKNNLISLERRDELDRNFKDAIDFLHSSLTDNMMDILSEESLVNKTIEGFLAYRNEIGNKYEQIVSELNKVLDSNSLDYSLIVSTLSKDVERNVTEEKEVEGTINELQKNWLENEKLLRDGVQLNESNVSEISTLRDTQYIAVQTFLERHGITSHFTQLKDNLNNLLSNNREEEKQICDAIQSLENVLAKKTDNRNKILKENNEEELRKGLLVKGGRRSKLGEKLGQYFQKLSKLEISPADYSIQNINIIDNKT